MERNAADLDDPPLPTSLSLLLLLLQLLSVRSLVFFLLFLPSNKSSPCVSIGFLYAGESSVGYRFPAGWLLRSPPAPPPPLSSSSCTAAMSARAFPFIHHLDVFPRPAYEKIPNAQRPSPSL
jgi:hypothetical protein